MVPEIISVRDLRTEAKKRDEAVCRLWQDMNGALYDLGEHAEIVYSRALYQYLADDNGKAFKTGDEWLAARIPEVGRSTVYRARKYYRELKDVPRRERRLIKPCNAPILGQLSDSVKKDPKWIRKAQVLPEREFVKAIRTELPEQHVSVSTQVKLRPSEDQKSVIDEAIKASQAIQKAQDAPCGREEALAVICKDWMDSGCELEQYQGKTNREAYGVLNGD